MTINQSGCYYINQHQLMLPRQSYISIPPQLLKWPLLSHKSTHLAINSRGQYYRTNQHISPSTEVAITISQINTSLHQPKWPLTSHKSTQISSPTKVTMTFSHMNTSHHQQKEKKKKKEKKGYYHLTCQHISPSAHIAVTISP